MNRRFFLKSGLAAMVSPPLFAALNPERLDDAAGVLQEAVTKGTVTSAVLHVTQRDASFTRHFGQAKSPNAMFLLGSITKPICMTALMALFDRGEFKLDDPLKKFIPQYTEDGRDHVTLRHLLTHVSGLPDQLAENDRLRREHSGLPEFVAHAIRTPLQFTPGSRYQYSSMAILLASRVAEIISGSSILDLVDRSVCQSLGLKYSALGLARFRLEEVIPCQTEFAAPEAGAGDPKAQEWDWNSRYWRNLGAPWGGMHASAPDVAAWLAEFLLKTGKVVKPETARLMVTNQNAAGLTPRGLGFNVGATSGSKGCSARTFGHTGSTGTLAWADPATQTICVVLTSLPGRAVQPHPRDVTGERVVAAGQL